MKRRGATLAAVLIMGSTEAHAAVSPLDLNATLLGKPERFVPKGLDLGKGCQPPIDVSCDHVAPGIVYRTEDGAIIAIEMSRVDGRFRYPLPYGLKDTTSQSDVIAVFAKRGVRLHDNPNAKGVRLLTSGFITIQGQAGCSVDFEFSPAARLDKARVKCASAYD